MIRSNGPRRRRWSAAGGGDEVDRAAPARRADAVGADIGAGDGDRDRVDVGRGDGCSGPAPRRRQREDAGSGAEVGDVREAVPPRQPVERDQAAVGGEMLAGAERQPRLDGEAEVARADRIGMGGGVDDEAPGADRREPRLAERHPVGVAEVVDLRAARRGRRDQRVERGQVGGGRRGGKVSVERPCVGLRRVGLVGQQRRRRLGIGEGIVGERDRLGLGARRGQADAPAASGHNLRR